MAGIQDLEGKFALVTGASKGIGRASAVELANMGANIVVNYNSSPKEAERTVELAKACGVDAFAAKADVGDPDQVKSMLDEATTRFGQIDILVNNAGVIDDGLLLRMTDKAWDRVINPI